jgi:uncharacterized protein (TIGR02598 family)
MKKLHHTGFTLIEVTLALGVASFAMLAIFGLLPAGLLSSQTSTQQTLATNIASAIIADMTQVPSASAIAASSPAVSGTSAEYHIDVTKTYPSTAPKQFYVDGSGALQTSAATARYSVSLTLLQSGSRQAANGMITIAWPAAAQNPLDKVNVFVALDRN